MEHTDYYVYVLFRETGVPFYVGKGRGGRWLAHEFRYLEARTKKNAIIRRMVNLRIDIPKVKVAEGLSNIEAMVIERALIAAIGRGDDGPLTNLTDGGEGASFKGHVYTEEEKAELSRKRKGQGLGRKMTAEQCAKLSASHMGKKRSPEHIKNAANGRRGKKRGPFTAAHIEKLRVSHAGQKHKPGQTERIAAANRGQVRPDEWKREQSARMTVWWAARRAKA